MRKKKQLRKQLMIFGFSLLGTAALFFIIISYISKYDYASVMDALFVTGFIIFFFGWMFYITNVGIFDVTAYGFSRFFKAMVNKKPRKTLEEFLYTKNLVDTSVIRGLMIVGFLVMFASLIMYLIYYTT